EKRVGGSAEHRVLCAGLIARGGDTARSSNRSALRGAHAGDLVRREPCFRHHRQREGDGRGRLSRLRKSLAFRLATRRREAEWEGGIGRRQARQWACRAVWLPAAVSRPEHRDISIDLGRARWWWRHSLGAAATTRVMVSAPHATWRPRR